MNAPQSDNVRVAGSRSIRLHLGAIVLIVALCAPPLLIGLGGRDSRHTMENVALVVSQETWLRWHENDLSDPFITTNNFMPRYAKPPLVAWMNMLAWADLDPEEANPTQLLLRARIVGACMAMVMLASIYWLGAAFGGFRAGLIAALAAGSMIFLQYQARTASYDVHSVAWLTLSTACAMWGIRPDQPQGPRRAWWWFVASGGALGLAVLAKNPLPMALAIIPVIASAVVLRHRRGQALGGLLVMLMVALIVAAPWYGHVLATYDNAWVKLTSEFRQPRASGDGQQFYYYAILLAWLLPWTPWVVSGLIHPFMPAVRERRRIEIIPWIWFAGVLLLFSLPDAKVQRYIFPIVPAAAILIAQVWRDHDVLARAGRTDQSPRGLIHSHWIALSVASVGLGVFLGWQEELLGLFDEALAWFPPSMNNPDEDSFASTGREIIVQPIPRVVAGAIGLLLMFLALAGWRVHVRARPVFAGVVTAMWSVLALSAFWWGYSGAPSGRHPIRASAETLRDSLGECELVRYVPIWPDPTDELNEEFRFYYGRLIRPMAHKELADRVAGEDDLAVLAPKGRQVARALASAGLIEADLIQVDRNLSLRLWREAAE